MRLTGVVRRATTAVIVVTAARYLYNTITSKWINRNYESATVDDTIRNSQTGDLIYFRARGVDILHSIVSYFTHIGMVLRDPITDEVFIVETHAEGDTDHMGFQKRSGVNFYDLRERINQYDGNVYYSRLIPSIPDINDKVRDFIEKCKGVPYDHGNRNHYINTCMLCVPTTRQDMEKMFCSEFVGHTLRDLGLLKEDTRVSCFTPSSFVGMYSHTGEQMYDEPKAIEFF